MNFWDASAVVPLCLFEPGTRRLKAISDDDPDLVVWWATRTECVSALRQVREGTLSLAEESEAPAVLMMLASNWLEIEATEQLRSTAERLLMVHPLRAADAFQLAAALQWSEGQPSNHGFVSLDARLRRAAEVEGFAILPVAGG